MQNPNKHKQTNKQTKKQTNKQTTTKNKTYRQKIETSPSGLKIVESNFCGILLMVTFTMVTCWIF